MKFLKSMTKKEIIVYILTLIYSFPFFVLITANMFFSLFQTTYMELYLDTEKPLYKPDSPTILLLFTLAYIMLCVLVIRKGNPSPRFCSIIEHVALIWAVCISLFIILLFRVRVACDSGHLNDIAIDFLSGNYSPLTRGYLLYYPHQLGMIGLMQVIYYIFGIENFTVMQLLNVISIFSVVYYLHRITEEMFHSLQIRVILSSLCIGLLPLYFYSTFIYGDIPGLGFAVPAIYYAIRYLNTQRQLYIIPTVLCTTLAIVLKSNNSIILVAILLVLLLHFLNTKSFYNFLFAILLLFVPFLANAGINSYYANVSGLNTIPSGLPKIAWVAMGLQENEYIENGWYNGYNTNIYADNNYDLDATTHACITSIQKSINYFISEPKSGLHFFYKKFISQWNDPGYQAQITVEWYSRHRDDHSNLALYLIYGNGRLLVEDIMNLYHFMILLGGSIFAYYNLKNKNLANTLLSLCVFGGYFFHLIWEAGGRYGLGYFVMCVPMAAWGFWKLASLASIGISRLRKKET